jgi:hypothetical protein
MIRSHSDSEIARLTNRSSGRATSRALLSSNVGRRPHTLAL